MTPEDAADRVAALVDARARPYVIAVDGPSGAGTSTLADALGRRLDGAVLRGDDFYRDMPEDERWELDAAEGLERYFDWQRLRREALEPLSRGEPARYRPYSWTAAGGLAAEPVVVPASAVVIVDGVYSARPQFADLLDLRVLVETPAEERLRRLHVRGHGNDRWWSRWSAAEDLYFMTVRPPASFDLEVPGA